MPTKPNNDRPQRRFNSDQSRSSTSRGGYSSSNRSDRSSSDRYSRDSSQPSRGGYSQDSRSGGFRRGGEFSSNNRNSSSGSRFRRNTKRIDPSKYVSKAQDVLTKVAYIPKFKFIDFDIDQAIKENIIKKGYITPTPIQDQAIPYIMEGRDLIGLANTGTGKTGAFLIPLINKVIKDRRNNVLIVVPTRELAIQIKDELNEFSANTGVKSALCIGGADIRRQSQSLRAYPQFVIGTPGRLKDLQNRRILNLTYFSNIVLDEVDRMLDMGFVADIKELISFMAKERQSLFFSATMNSSIDAIAKSFLNNPITVQVNTPMEGGKNIEQDIIRVLDRKDKDTKLSEILKKEEFKKVLIFTRTKRAADILTDMLYDNGFKAQSIHGDKSQAKRQKALQAFRDDKVNILVATDVAARGLDISDISHVINYDEPETFEDYIHRIGRTGRGDKKGIAITFVG